ncbi:antiviral innate immune response receptor RIG-I-like isoform X1 [Asterias amurensis]|uniref:antiviral innate immune response receptor RIG-I-like isoform X1 n=2 Tax=Asterias amurensis TaxID=7602 RepID=UPI003AB79FD0
MAYNPHRKRRDPALLTVVFRDALINFLNLDVNLLSHLVQFRLITVEQHYRLSKHQNGFEYSVDLLLKMIEEVQIPDKVSLFMKALRESGEDTTNALLADFIAGVKSPKDFDIEHQLITKFYPQLQVIDPAEMAIHLKYIRVDEKESLIRKCEVGEIPQARTTLLLLTLRTLDPGWFEVFLEALELTKHGSIADELRSRRETDQMSRNKQKENNPYSYLSGSIESLTLDGDMEDDTTQGQPTGDSFSMEETDGSAWGGFKEPSSARLHRTTSFDSPDASRRGFKQRSRSSSMKRPHPIHSRKLSCSPKRKGIVKQGFFKRKRSPSEERPPQVVHHHYHNTVNAPNSTNLTTVFGGDNNTINILKEDKGHVSKKAFTCRTQPEPRLAGEDQPDHAAMPPEDDIQAGPMATGDSFTPQEDKTTSAAQRPLLYDDQLELAEDAVRGKNTVLVAPTGSGKTHVAAYIIHDHFISQRPKPIRDRCALFLVTTVNLVDQQKNKLRELLLPMDFFSVIGLFGASESTLQKEMTSKNVIVLTAQLLENALDYIPLDRFSLLVFDECHLCQKDHAYNTIMARYLNEKQSGNTNLPQIIGMTASLGTGKAGHQHQADQHTIQICANMDAQSISMVTRHTEQLKNRVNIPKEVEPIEVNCRQVNPFADKIKEIMKKVEELLLESPSSAIRRHMRNEKIPGEKGSQAYRQWCDRMKRNAQKIITQDTDYRILQTCIRHLMGYNSALLINKQVRSKDAYKYIDQMIGTMKDRIGSFVENDFKLLKIFSDEQRALEKIKNDRDNENPLLEKLCEIILEEYQNRPQSRAILFVKTIDTTQALQDWILDTRKLKSLNPGRIAGSRDMNSNQQNKVIEDFRRGDHHMLVATNLLEQGTDVPACNLVIRLDYVPSDFGHVQIKGRTRAKDGRSYLISLIDSNAADRDGANRQREAMMTQAALNLKASSEVVFREQMESQQERDRINREVRQQQKRDIVESNAGERFSFCCGMCGKHAFFSDEIGVYRGSLYVVLDTQFPQQMRMKPHPKPKKLGQDSTIIGKIYCEKCEHDWGSLARVKTSYYPSIRIAQFSLVNVVTNEGHTYRKWKNAPFDAEKLENLPQATAVRVPSDLLKKLIKL